MEHVFFAKIKLVYYQENIGFSSVEFWSEKIGAVVNKFVYGLACYRQLSCVSTNFGWITSKLIFLQITNCEIEGLCCRSCSDLSSARSSFEVYVCHQLTPNLFEIWPFSFSSIILAVGNSIFVEAVFYLKSITSYFSISIFSYFFLMTQN